MNDDSSSRAQPDRSRIRVDDQYELRYWTTTLGVTRDALNYAINAVGNEPYTVRQYLARQIDYASHY